MQGNFRFWFAVAAWAAVMQMAGICQAATQNVPDILWITNGPYAHFGPVMAVSFSADSKLLASGSEDGHAKVWSVDTKALVIDAHLLRNSPWMTSVALYTPDDLLLTGSDDGRVRGWSIASGLRLFGSGTAGDGDSDNIVGAVAISIDRAIAIGSSYISLQTAQGGFTLDDDNSEYYSHVFSLSFSQDGFRLASAGADGTAKIWRVSDGNLLQVFTGHSYIPPEEFEDDTVINTVYSVDFSPDGTLVASAGADNAVRLWRVSDGMEIRVFNSTNCGVAKFSADGKLLFTVNNGPINVWRVSDGQLLCTYTNANAGPLAVASNGKYLAYGRGDGSVVLAYTPLVLELFPDGHRIILRWTGGSGRYQVQRRNHPAQGKWHNVGHPTTATSYTNKMTRHPVFYRVQSLPNL